MSKPKKERSPIKPKKVQFQIDENIPLPTRNAGGGKKPCKYPISKMEVGHSFLVEKVYTRARANVLATTIRTAAKKSGLKAKFSVRKDADVGALRVWRVA